MSDLIERVSGHLESYGFHSAIRSGVITEADLRALIALARLSTGEAEIGETGEISDAMIRAGIVEFDRVFSQFDNWKEKKVAAIYRAMTWEASDLSVGEEMVERLRSLSSAVGAGMAENTNDPVALIAGIAWGVEHIQQVEAKRTADLIEDLSKRAYDGAAPRITWGEVRKAVLERAGLTPNGIICGHDQHLDANCSRTGAAITGSIDTDLGADR